MKNIFLLVAICVGHLCSLYSQDKSFNPVTYPNGYTARIDAIYTRVNGWEGRMDIYNNPTADIPTPILINIHGGGWFFGKKESRSDFHSWFNHGYAVANVEYRLSGVARAPAAVEDIRCALIYLYKHAKELNIDTNKIVISGASAGGHLTLMGGLLAGNPKFDTNCKYDGEIKVAAIIDRYGVTDLFPIKERKSVRIWLKEHIDDKSFADALSPLYYVDNNSPPTFIIHGDSDPIVPYEQSVMLFKKLNSYNVKTELVTIEGGKHGKFSAEESKLIEEKLWRFLGDLDLK